MEDPELQLRVEKADLPLAPKFGEEVGAAVSKALDAAPAAHKILKDIVATSKR